MPVIIRKSVAADRNLHPNIAGRSFNIIIHSKGELEGFTTVEGDDRGLRIFLTERSWRRANEEEQLKLKGEFVAEEDTTTGEGEAIPPGTVVKVIDLSEWAEALTGGTVASLEVAIDSLGEEFFTPGHVLALHEAEVSGKNRVTALGMIICFGEAVETLRGETPPAE